MTYSFYKCNIVNEDFYDEQLDNKEKQKIIDKYNLINKGFYKQYWMNNVMIQMNKSNKSFKYIKDIKVFYDKSDNVLVHEYETKECDPFGFYDPDIESEYNLYDLEIDGVTIILKDFKEYFTLEYSCNDISSFKKLINNK
tara:strand:- start:2207 stop:2626 length:420 start_codon:yes stop_codon:yes gene_type:complete